MEAKLDCERYLVSSQHAGQGNATDSARPYTNLEWDGKASEEVRKLLACRPPRASKGALQTNEAESYPHGSYRSRSFPDGESATKTADVATSGVKSSAAAC